MEREEEMTEDEIFTCSICKKYKGTSKQMPTHVYHCRKKQQQDAQDKELKIEAVLLPKPAKRVVQDYPRASEEEKEPERPKEQKPIIDRLLGAPGPETRQKKEQKKQARRLAKEEKQKARSESKAAKKKERHAPRDKFYSELHPEAYATVKKMLPRLHMYIFATVLAIMMALEVLKKNYDFMIDWYNATWVLPEMVKVIRGDIGLWFQTYGPQFMVVLSFLILAFIMLYMFVWRAFFKTYIKFSQGSERPEGRVYWRTNNMWTKRWDKWYGSPPRTMNTYYIKQGFWPLFNIMNPTSTIARLDTTLEESCTELGIWKLKVAEKRHRIKVGNDQRHLITSDIAFPNGYIPTPYAEGRFDGMSKKCVDDTTNLSFANATTRNNVMGSSLRLVPKKTRRNILDARKKQQDKQQDNNQSDRGLPDGSGANVP
jgi:hypothetical protein